MSQPAMVTLEPSLEELPERRFAVRRHVGPFATIEETRRPLYQHLIMHELVGGPPVVRWLDEPEGERVLDVLVGATCGFDGDDVVRVEIQPEGLFAVAHYEGPPSGLPAARDELSAWVAAEGLEPTGPLLQVHLMDEIDGEIEQELQLPVRRKGPQA
ncbi:MAG: GyrI-like domain-containing protein [Thermoplasmatota archaeon]